MALVRFSMWTASNGCCKRFDRFNPTWCGERCVKRKPWIQLMTAHFGQNRTANQLRRRFIIMILLWLYHTHTHTQTTIRIASTTIRCWACFLFLLFYMLLRKKSILFIRCWYFVRCGIETNRPTSLRVKHATEEKAIAAGKMCVIVSIRPIRWNVLYSQLQPANNKQPF